MPSLPHLARRPGDPFLDGRRESPRISEALRLLAPQAWAALLVAGCAGAAPVRPDADPLRAELRALRKENEALSARIEALSSRVDLLTARAIRPGDGRQPDDRAVPSPAAPVPGSSAPVVPPDLAIVKMSPEPARSTSSRAPGRPSGRPARAAPPVPTVVPIQEPDQAVLDAVAPSGRRPLAAEAEAELRDARALTGLSRAHALEDFTARYPQHPAADNALVEASAAYQAAGREEAACALSRRAVEEYPAGDGQSDALERLAACEARRGAPDAEQRLLARLRADFPGTPAAQRAEARLSQGSGRSGETAPRDVPARSSP